MSFAREMQDFMSAYQKTQKSIDDSAYTRASTDFMQARTRAMTADQDFVDAAVRRREAAIPPSTANPTAATGGTVAQGQPAVPANNEEFIAQMMPHAQRVSAATGVDPRIIIAQGALESRWGRSAPGNNFFGIKSHGQPGGQTLSTTESVGGQTVRTQDSFRRFGSMGEAADGYGQFILTNPRYRAMRQAQGLDAQIAALGRSGYATDPDYAAKIAQIARSIRLPQPQGQATQAPQGAAPSTGVMRPDSNPMYAREKERPVYDERGQLLPEHGGLSGLAAEQAQRTGVGPGATVEERRRANEASFEEPGVQYYAEGGLVEDEGIPPRGGMIDEAPAPAAARPPVQAVATAQGGVPTVPGGAAEGGAMVSAPIPQPRLNEDQIEQQQVADALRSADKPRPQEAAAPSPAAAPRRASAVSMQEESPEQRQEVTRPGNASSAQQRPANAPQLPQILQGALRYIASRMPQRQAMPGQQGQYRLGNNEDTPRPSEYEQVSRMVDPSGELSAGQRAIRVMEARHDLALMKGDVDGANKFAAGIIQYTQRLSARLASIGIVAGQNGNMGGMVAATVAAYNAIPNGPTIRAGEPAADGSVSATITSPSGRTAQLRFTPRQIFESALGLANGSGYWDAMMRASQQTADGLPTDEMDRRLAAITSTGNTPAGGTQAPSVEAQADKPEGSPQTAVPAGQAPTQPTTPATPPTAPAEASTAPPGQPTAPTAAVPGAPNPSAPAVAIPTTSSPAQAPSPPAQQPVAPARPDYSSLPPRPQPPREPNTQGMNREQATIANTQFRTTLARFRDELREWEQKRDRIDQQFSEARREDQRNERVMQQQEMNNQRADRRTREQIAADDRRSQRTLSAEDRRAARTRQDEERRASRLRDPDGSTVRQLQPEVQQAVTGGVDMQQFQQRLSPDAKDTETTKYIATGMVNAATKLSHWGNTPEQSAAAVQRMVGVRLPGGGTPYRTLGKDSAGNEQVELLTQPQGATEAQPTGIVLRMTPSALREIESLRRAYEPIATRRQREAGQPSGAAQGFERMMRGLGGAMQGAGVGFDASRRDADSPSARDQSRASAEEFRRRQAIPIQ